MKPKKQRRRLQIAREAYDKMIANSRDARRINDRAFHRPGSVRNASGSLRKVSRSVRKA